MKFHVRQICKVVPAWERWWRSLIEWCVAENDTLFPARIDDLMDEALAMAVKFLDE